MNQLLSEPPKCVTETGTWCQQVFRLTGNEWLAASASWLIEKPLRILLIVVIALLIRYLGKRLIDRLARSAGGQAPTLLRSLKERAPQAMGTVIYERREQRAKTIASVLKSVLTFLIFGIAFVMALGEFDINLGPIIASAGIVGVALGFGAQNLVKDFLSGIFMMLEDQYGVGDVVDVGAASGTIEGVGLRVTTLRDLNGTVWYVRNGEILSVGNSSQGFAVAVVDVPLGYGADVDLATSIIDRVAREVTAEEPTSKDVIEKPQVLGVEKVTAEGIIVRLTVKVRPGRQWAVQRVLRARIMKATEDGGLEPPLGRLFGPSRPTGQDALS